MGEIEKIYGELFSYCQAEDFAGWDPFDGLNSRYFQATPLRHIAPARLLFLQVVKRSARNLRPLLKIEKGVNPKGIALFALAELSRFRSTKAEAHAERAKRFLAQLLDLSIENPKSKVQHRSWGYNFDWQSRAFFAPCGTPTIVPTAFAAQAFSEAFELFGDEAYARTCGEVCEFIKSALNRSFESDTEVCFSYTPLDRSVIFNASLLAAEVLANRGGEENLELAATAARFVVDRQRNDGAWAYGPKLRHAWVDNFHTAYILLSLHRLQSIVPHLDGGAAVEKGLCFWLDNFFLEDGAPKYFDRESYPIDVHSASAAIVALCELNEVDPRCLPLANKVAGWLISNMRDESGYFYYQKRKRSTVKTPFVRWSNAWTAYALARLLEGGEQ
ncbi:MAG: terpene cyclase/mutase family protein [Acidobacteria bacterium]|nr:terpene cyclase/mutase family protein [Acidobacteriota bacterium]